MKLIFSHGKESGPYGRKILALARIALAKGYHVQSLDYQDMPCPEARADKLTHHLAAIDEPVLLVGSSMGAYVSLVASQRTRVAGLFLLAPAVGLPGYTHRHFDLTGMNVEIVQGWQDTVIPVENVIDFAKSHRTTLHLVDSDHRLASAKESISLYFINYLNKHINK